MSRSVIIDAVRTPIGKGKPTGALAGVHPVDLEAHVLQALVERTGIDPAEVDDVIGGTVSQVGEQSLNITRNAVLAAGFPESVPATTVDRQCGSSQQAAAFAAQGIDAGAYDLVIATGVESMSRVPMGSAVTADPFSPGFRVRYPDGLIPQGIAAERIAAKWGLSRADVDSFSLRSHQLAAEATATGRFDREITAVKAPGADGALHEVLTDEGIRAGGTLERLAQLPAAFRSPQWEARYPELPWVVTAANASQISDGAAAVLVTSDEYAQAHGLTPRARFHTFAVSGDDPLMMLTAPIPATQKVLQRAGMTMADIDLVEINEAFASVVLAWAAELGADLDTVNVNGGAIALGHPLGASGARLTATLLNAMEQRDAHIGLQVMCEAGGLANATIIERLR
ncbi:thiolase family protein [Aquihabitans sp. McL0605]|uniref:thiolase family protein n=1 Tax=Aquihabitans sp. McL0605 TaxID=3415671 RepID=UPI003CF9FEB9